ncbi:hypothetical protein CWO85_01195 [Candidatus Phytoplasma ziziphi]|uniref:Uncharacterized protein n=1 Tax=Ziziphus jujuba witches'-broom phytoplasma TaxID=135727 RepID=A0A660HMR2_ZIZJU|nr:hypothetical protein [Candidatus Phytoplasma ziziphi]AYJ01149.1 hypothetical protein CWO85_01195 [Candidatus Phytoplasma ziziphi]
MYNEKDYKPLEKYEDEKIKNDFLIELYENENELKKFFVDLEINKKNKSTIKKIQNLYVKIAILKSMITSLNGFFIGGKKHIKNMLLKIKNEIQFLKK